MSRMKPLFSIAAVFVGLAIVGLLVVWQGTDSISKAQVNQLNAFWMHFSPKN